jgi:glycine betaine/proline transport system ATP-binding protein
VTTASPTELRTIRRESVSMVFQHFALLHLTVLDNAAYALDPGRRQGRAPRSCA